MSVGTAAPHPVDEDWLGYWRLVDGSGRVHLTSATGTGDTLAGWQACGLRLTERVIARAMPGEPAGYAVFMCTACVVSC